MTNRIVLWGLTGIGGLLTAYLVWLIFAGGSGAGEATAQEAEQEVVSATGEPGPYVVLTVDGQATGEIVIDLNVEGAPLHAERILKLVEDGAYDNVVFHRVIDGFMAQTGDVEHGVEGGDMRLAGTGGSDLPDLPAEFTAANFDRGVVGMARSNSPDSANSQFFIMFEPAPHLNNQYTVVGAVTEGMDVVDAIKLGTGQNGAVIGAPDKIETATIRE